MKKNRKKSAIANLPADVASLVLIIIKPSKFFEAK